MTLTIDEETKIKSIIAEKDKEAQIEIINKNAYDAIQIKKDEIQAIEDKRIADLKALDG